VLHEPVTWHEVVAGSCILGAIALIHRGRDPSDSARPAIRGGGANSFSAADRLGSRRHP